jgi:Fe-S-cluster containining protein
VIVAADEFNTLEEECRIPFDLIVPVKKSRYVMKGTEGRLKRCTGLQGIVGQIVCCTIYDARPASCRGFRAAWEAGVVNPKCDMARAAYGLFAFGLF